MGILSDLEPKNVFRYFEEISQIPRPSYKEEKISAYLVEFAKAHNLEYYQDSLYNVVMIKDATPGYEDEEPIIIQGHMDMVCEKEPGKEIDFENDPLDLKIEGDWVAADGTTLGGDDGVAVAFALAILDDDTISHPRLEVVITVSEEVGMEGAKGIDLSMLKGHKLLNLDSEEEGIMLASCAGGSTAVTKLPVWREEKKGTLYQVKLSGLTGGHSGAEIDKGRGNSNILFARILLALDGKVEFSLQELAGGSKQNAIPRETSAAILVKNGQEDAFESIVNTVAAELKDEFSTPDPELQVSFTKGEAGKEFVLTEESKDKVLALLFAMPNGIQTMSNEIAGLVETSLNLGILKLEEHTLRMEYAIRSSVATARNYLEQRLERIGKFIGASTEFSADYPAWEYKKDSSFREDVIRVYEEMFGVKPEIQAIHAGLECGILAGKITDLDGVSMGPEMKDIHTTEERLSIASTKRTYDYVLKLLEVKHTK